MTFKSDWSKFLSQGKVFNVEMVIYNLYDLLSHSKCDKMFIKSTIIKSRTDSD